MKRLLLLLLITSCSQSKLYDESPPQQNYKDYEPIPNIINSLCPADMAYVEGSFCPTLLQNCDTWLDHSNRYPNLRCKSWSPNPKCLSQRIPVRFCIDIDEQTDSNTLLPINNISWTTAQAICQLSGKRLCYEDEWTYACEGPNELGYPYGINRDSNICNIDRTDLLDSKGKLIDHRTTVDAFPYCLSPTKIHNMVGNIDEFVTRRHATYPHRSSLAGGWWGPLRNNCRAKS